MQHQPSQGTVVCWDRFLHVRSIRVLLVENDHSTRHVVSALLRNCNYEVLDAANGLQAWKILQDLTKHVDLVLTEVVMPNLSGIALLCKIMSHKTRKNIPVVMMSSNDSMGLVVTCLSKGAVDFLVKPIRKNELKNLWQHVWRRFHSSSGSGCESATQTEKYVKSRGSEKSENIESNDGSNGLTVGNGSDDGSGAQNLRTHTMNQQRLPNLNALSVELAEIVNQGKLVSDEIIINLLSKRLEMGEAKGESGFILDGFPRTVRQAEILDEVTDIDLVVNLKLPESVLIEKCLGRRICGQCGKNFNVATINFKGENGNPDITMAPLPPQCASKLKTRSDDAEAIIKERLRVYDEKSQPVEGFYRDQGKLLEFNLPGGIPESWPKLLEALNLDDNEVKQYATA